MHDPAPVTEKYRVPCQVLLVQSQQRRYRNNVWICSQVNNKDTRTMLVVVNLKPIYTSFWCFRCWLWTSKCQLSKHRRNTNTQFFFFFWQLGINLLLFIYSKSECIGKILFTNKMDDQYFLNKSENKTKFKNSVWLTVFGTELTGACDQWVCIYQICSLWLIKSCHYIETSQLICYANQLTGFYTMSTLAFYELILDVPKCSDTL